VNSLIIQLKAVQGHYCASATPGQALNATLSGLSETTTEALLELRLVSLARQLVRSSVLRIMLYMTYTEAAQRGQRYNSGNVRSHISGCFKKDGEVVKYSGRKTAIVLHSDYSCFGVNSEDFDV